MSNSTIPQIGDTKKGHVFTEGGWTPTNPPKKKRTVLKVFLVIGVLMVAGIAGCTALVAGAANEASKSIDKSIAKEEAVDKPVVVAEGAAFTHDGYQVAAGWKVANEPYSGLTIKGLRITNVSHSDEQDTPMFTFTLWSGQTNQGEIEASGNTLAKGQDSKMDAFSTDDIKKGTKYDRITVEDMW